MGLGNVLIVGYESSSARPKLLRAGFDYTEYRSTVPSQSVLESFRLLIVGRNISTIPDHVKTLVAQGKLSVVSEWDGSVALAKLYGVTHSSYSADSNPNGYTKTNITPAGHALKGVNFNISNPQSDYIHFTRFSFTNLSQITLIARNDYDSRVFLSEVNNTGAGRAIILGTAWMEANSGGLVATMEDAIFQYAVSPVRPSNASDEKKLLNFYLTSSANFVSSNVITPGGKKIIQGVNTVKFWANGDLDSSSETIELSVDGVRLFGPSYLNRMGSESSNVSTNFVGEFNLPASVIGKSTIPFQIYTTTNVGYAYVWLEFSFALVPTLVPMEDGGIPFPEAIQKKENILALRTQANKFRKDNGMTELSWTDPNVVSGLTPIKAKHWNELEAAVKEVYDSREVPIAVPEVQKQFDVPIKANGKQDNVKQLANRIFNILRSFRNY